MAESVSVEPNRLEAHQKSPYRHLWWLLLFGIAGCFIYFTKNDEVFAAASLNLSMPKDQIIQKASEWAVKLGYDPNSRKTPPSSLSDPSNVSSKNPKLPVAQSQPALKSITFSYDDDAKSFLEYELGVRKANELMTNEIPVWYWRVRLARELQQEEIRIWINPEGKLSGVDHDFENDKEIKSLTHKDAEAFARNFVEKEVGNSLEGFQLIKDEESQKPKRKDHSFTFEDTKKDYKGAKLRVFISLAGDQIDAYNRYLHVPETWERKFANIRSYNSMLAKIAQIFMTLLGLASVFVFGWAVMTGNIRWKPVIVIALIYSVFPFLDNINNFNELIDEYDTTITFVSYIANAIARMLAGILPQTLGAVILFGAAEALYRRTFPDHLAVENIFTLKGLRSKPVVLALLVGQLLFMIELGWVVFYYLMGQKIGFWCPLGVENYEILSSYVPAISAMRVGISASFMEEALYRVVGMSLMMRISGNFWVANFFQAAAWGFAHSTYPQQPFYARGVELTLGGLLDGWILRRYGLIACVSSHYLFDTFLGVKPLFHSSDLSLKTTAFLSVLPFVALLAYGAAQSVKAKGDETLLLNRSINETIHVKELEEAEPEEKPIIYQPIVPQRRLFFFAITVVLGFACFLMRPQLLNADAKVNIDRPQAEARAAANLARHGIEAPGYSVVSWVTDQNAGEAEQYIYEQLGFAKTDAVVKGSHSGGYCWRVRFFKPKTPEEYEVQLDGNGQEIGCDVRLAEETKGEILSKEAALKLATHDLDTIYPYLRPYELESASEQKRPSRTDWTFTFRSKQFDAGEARFKTNMTVLGKIVSGANWSWEVPDKWKFERSKRQVREEIAGYLVMGGYVIAMVLAFIWGLGVLRARAIKVRPALLIGLLYILTFIPQQLNALPTLFASYPTTTPVNNYLTDQVSRYAQAYIGGFCVAAIIAAFAFASLRILFPQVRLSNFFLAVFRPHNRENQGVQRSMWVDGALAGYAYVAIIEFVAQTAGVLRTHFSPEVQQSGLATVSSLLNLQFPPIDSLISAPVDGVRELLMTCIAVGFYARFCPSAKVYFAVMSLVALAGSIGNRHYQDVLISFASAMAVAILNWYFIARVAKTNPVAYFTAGLGAMLFIRTFSIIIHGLPVMLPTLAVSAVLLAGPAIMAAILSMRSEMPAPVVAPVPPELPAEITTIAPETAEIAAQDREKTPTGADKPEAEMSEANEGDETPEDRSEKP